MDRTEVIRSLARMFEEPEENDYVIEEKQIDKKRYLALVTKDRDDLIQTHPDYEALIAIMQHYNTKNLNYAVKKLNDNKRKFFVEYTDSEREKFLDETRDFCKRLIGTNAMTDKVLGREKESLDAAIQKAAKSNCKNHIIRDDFER